MLIAVAAYSQADEWQRSMDEGAMAELAGDYVRAAAGYEKAAAASAVLARSDTRRAFAWNAVATMYDALGRFADAERAYRRGLREAENARGQASPVYALLLENLATLYVEIGQPAMGEKMARQALAVHESADPRDEFRLAMARNALAQILTSDGKLRDAESLLKAALGHLEKDPKTRTEAAIVVNNLAVVYYLRKDHAEAERLQLRALNLMEASVGPDHPMLIRPLNNLAALARREGRLEECGEKLRRAMDIAERRLGSDHPLYGALLASYAEYLRRQGEKSQAKAVRARSLQILKDNDRRYGMGSVVDISALKVK
jgi:tetratricopeptide (TPR) repeat protein